MSHGLCVVRIQKRWDQWGLETPESLEIMTWAGYKGIEVSKWMKIMRRKNFQSPVIMGEMRQRLGNHGNDCES